MSSADAALFARATAVEFAAMTPDIATIASGLSEAQRRAVIAAPETLFGESRVLALRNRWSTKVVMNLRKKGVCETYDAGRDRLTTLGLAVRAYLQEQAK